MSLSVTPFLMFPTGQAERALDAYLALFPDAALSDVIRRDGPPGGIARATLHLAGQRVMVLDSDVKHAFDFTPSFSFFVACESEGQQQRLHDALIEGGQTLMPLGDYGFSRRFAWLNDRFGVSWQLNLA